MPHLHRIMPARYTVIVQRDGLWLRLVMRPLSYAEALEIAILEDGRIREIDNGTYFESKIL